ITAAKEAAKRDVLYLSPHSYANATTGSMGHTHIFRESYNAWMAGKAISFYINQMLTDKRVFYATADYSWGHSSESSLRAFTKTEDTQMHPGALIPFPRPRYRDIESVMYQARDSGAGVMVLTLAGDDLVTAMQIAHNLDLDKTMEIIVPGLTQDTVRVTGVGALQGVISTVPWCWRLPTQFGNQKGIAFVEKYAQQHRVYPSSSAAAAYSLIYQYRDAAERANSTSSRAIIRALEGHTFTELKDQQTWRAFDHQSVQSVHVVKVKPRAEALKDPLREDYFDILLSIPGAMAARTESDWLAERQKAGVSGRLTSIK
ncbi:MAG: ABC transporter substrate-binding protein, partial [Oceanobacter sp.]